jgi:threonine dehydratase
MFTLAELDNVIPLVRAIVPPTPQYAWPLLKALTGVEIVVKHENHTPIGAFKLRGGIVYFDRLKRARPQVQGIVTATRGNHGQSLAFAGTHAGVAVTIVVPHGNSTESDVSIAPGITARTFAFGTSRSGSNLSNEISLFLQGKETA